jgi:chaperonin GroES
MDINFLDNTSYLLPNWAESIDEETLDELAAYVVDAKEVDEGSREGWLAETEMWMDMAQQTIEKKNLPWPNASSVKYPLLSQSALSFHARAHQELLKGEMIVKGKVIGKDESGAKSARARRVEKVMSNQLLYELENWQDDTDRLLYVLPLVGTVFRKVSWNYLKSQPSSELVLAQDLCVNYYATDWERARKIHTLLMSRNEITEQQRLGNYSEVALLDPHEPEEEDEEGISDDRERVSLQSDIPHTILEAHCWYDLDGDGYDEPYIVTVEEQSKKVLRILPRFNPSRIEIDGDEIVRITPIEYVVAYKFLPDVESSLYGVGLGKLLGPSNAAIDTIINQMIDTGTLNTMPSGFIGRGVRLSRGGRIRLQPGEWQSVNSSGEDLARNFFAMPTKDPSPVLLNLLGMLIQSGEKLGSTTEALSGQNPGQNQPFSTTSAVMEQGLQVFLGIYKRVYRSMSSEFRLLYHMNHLHLSIDTYNDLLDEEEVQDPTRDFSPEGMDVLPEADPSLANSMRKQRRAQALIEGRRAGMPFSDMYIAKLFLEAIDEPRPEEALNQEPPPPTEQEIEMQKFKVTTQLDAARLQLDVKRFEHDATLTLAKAMESFAKAKALGDEGENKAMEQALKLMVERTKAEGQMQKIQGDAAKTGMNMAAQEQKHQNEMQKLNANIPGAAGANRAPPGGS